MLNFMELDRIHGLYDIKDNVIESFMEKHLKFSSAISFGMVYQDNAYVMTKGKTNTEKSASLCGIHTQFNISSVSKIITGMLVLALQDRGVLDINDSISRYLPKALSDNNKSFTNITLKMLLSHTSGLGNAKKSIYVRDEKTLREHVNEDVSRITKLFPGGNSFYYSNVGINLAGYICELATNRSFAELVKIYITGEKGMNLSETCYHISQLDDFCRGTYRGEKELITLPEVQDLQSFYPSTQLFSSLNDLCNLVHFILNETIKDKHRILSSNALRLMLTPQTQMSYENDEYYCITIGYKRYRNKNLYFHEGSVKGYFTRIYVMPDERFGMVILSNAEDIGFIQRISHYVLKKVANNSDKYNKLEFHFKTEDSIIEPIRFSCEYMAIDGTPRMVKIHQLEDKYIMELYYLDKNTKWTGQALKKEITSTKIIKFSNFDEKRCVFLKTLDNTQGNIKMFIVENIPYNAVNNCNSVEENRLLFIKALGRYKGYLSEGFLEEKCYLHVQNNELFIVFSEERKVRVIPIPFDKNQFATKLGIMKFLFNDERIVGFEIRYLQKFVKC